MELFLTDDIYVCPLMINTFEDIVRKSRSEIKNIIFKKKYFFSFYFSRRLTGSSVFNELPNKLKQDYVNELAYKLTVFDSSDVGR
jgi:hypothetical protein